MKPLFLTIFPSKIPDGPSTDAEFELFNYYNKYSRALISPPKNIFSFPKEKITPWLACQLGLFAEEMANKEDYSYAIQLGIFSMKCSVEIFDSDIAYLNSLRCGLILAKAGRLEEAESAFRDLLEFPTPAPQGGNEEIIALVATMGLIGSKNLKETLELYEQRLMGKIQNLSEENKHHFPEAELQEFYNFLFVLYGKKKDFAGAIHALSQSKNPKVSELIYSCFKRQCHIDQILSLATRLNFLGEHQISDNGRTFWREFNKF